MAGPGPCPFGCRAERGEEAILRSVYGYGDRGSGAIALYNGRAYCEHFCGSSFLTRSEYDFDNHGDSIGFLHVPNDILFVAIVWNRKTSECKIHRNTR